VAGASVAAGGSSGSADLGGEPHSLAIGVVGPDKGLVPRDPTMVGRWRRLILSMF
jgi:hypothetical protein